MHKPKRHSFVVEITDLEEGYSVNRLRSIIEDALDYGLYHLGHDSYFADLQVKSKRRVDAAHKRKR